MKLNEDLLDNLGVSDWGYVEDPIPESYQHYTDWVKKGDHVPLSYLADERKTKRSSLREFYPEFESAIVFLFSYAQEKAAQDKFYQSEDSNGFKMASYALSFEGEDYHHKLGEVLQQLGDSLVQQDPSIDYRLTLDIHPVLERDLAYRAGLGWFGKNSMLIHQKKGSFVMIGSLLLNKKLDLSKSNIQTDHCGNCRACIDVCPTEAIDEAQRRIIAKKCISTFTIEMFKPAPLIPGHVTKGTGEIFGCDLCQDVCPWNKKPLQKAEAMTWPNSDKANLLVETFLKPGPLKIKIFLESLSKRGFKKYFKGTSIERTGRDGLLKNIDAFIQKNHES